MEALFGTQKMVVVNLKCQHINELSITPTLIQPAMYNKIIQNLKISNIGKSGIRFLQN